MGNNDDIGALECRWGIGCDCWYDADYNEDDKNDLGAVEFRWRIGCDSWYDTAHNHHHIYNYSQGMDEDFHLVRQ